MKKFAKFLCVLIIAVVMCGVAAFAGCSAAVSVTSIEYSYSDGNQDIYTITYSDGSTSTFTTTNSKVSVTSIGYSYSEGNEDVYTVTYSDGSTSTFTITNGTDGEKGDSGSDVTVEDLYEYYKEIYGDITYSDFLSLYLSDSSSGDNSSVINECLQSVMKVYSEFEYTYTSSSFRPGGSSTTGTALTAAAGSAVIYQMDAEYTYILTNYHVIYYSSSYTLTGVHCYLYGSEGTPSANYNSSGYTTSYDYGNYAIECEYVGGSAASDIAVLRAKTSDITAINPNAKAVTLASKYYVGETAIAIGNSEDYGISATEGIVSVDNEYISYSVGGTTRSIRCLRIDTAIYEGNSGGGLFNKYGQLIGITNAGNTSDQNINYAIPVSVVQGTADNIIYYAENGDTTGSAYVITLGVTMSSANSRYTYDESTGYGEITEDATVSSVTSGSIAESLGVTAGSVIEKFVINGTEYDITRYFQLGDLLLCVRAGDVISFTLSVDGSEVSTSDYTVLSSDLSARA